MSKFSFFLVMIIFICYWIITIVFNFPEESLIIGKLYNQNNQFHKVLYQKWSFFAPPPTSNKRLYYTYLSEKDNNKYAITKVEVLSKLNKTIIEKYPINDIETNIYWTLSSLIDDFQKFIHDDYDNYSFITKCENDSCFGKYIDQNQDRLHSVSSFRKLLQHSIVLSNSLKTANISKIQISIYEHKINKYVDRYKKDNNVEQIVFSSKLYNLNTKKWEE